MSAEDAFVPSVLSPYLLFAAVNIGRHVYREREGKRLLLVGRRCLLTVRCRNLAAAAAVGGVGGGDGAVVCSV